MGHFLDTHHLPKLNKGEMSNLNQPITSNELEAVIKSSPINVSPGQDGYSTNYYQIFKEGVMLRLIPQIEAEMALPNSFHYATVTMIPKPHKGPIKKENYRPISLINIDAEIINKMIANRIQEYIKKIINHDQAGIIPEMQR